MNRAWAAMMIFSTAACGYDIGSSSGVYAPNEPGYAPVTISPAEGDQYEAVGTNPFITTESDPLSTFAADVDTASYDIFRRDLQELAALPSPDSVRVEEYLNAFRYADARPEAGAEHPFNISLEGGPSPFGDTTYLRIGIAATPLPEEREPANLVFLVDVSGSMSAANKLPLVKVMLEALVGDLGAEDRLSLVTYAGATAVVLPATAGSEKATILAAIEGLDAGGSTAGAAGIVRAYEQAQAGWIEGGPNHVILCTDGDFNVGLARNEELVPLIEEERATGITLTAVGFGYGNLNDAMMESVTSAGNGIYSVVSDEDQAIQYAHTGLLQSIYHVAKDMKIQVELNPDQVLAYRLIGYENRAVADEDFADDAVDGGEVGAGLAVTALYELVLPGQAIPAGAPRAAKTVDTGDAAPEGLAAQDLCEVRIRYKKPGASAEDPAMQVEATLALGALSPSVEATSADWQWAVAISGLAEIVKQSPYGSVGNLEAIGALVAPLASIDGARSELAGLLETAGGLLAP